MLDESRPAVRLRWCAGVTQFLHIVWIVALAVGSEDAAEQDGNIKRRECMQQALRRGLAYDLNPEYFLTGCNLEPIWGFDEWAAKAGCGKEPLDGTLLIHTAWTGSIDGTLTGKGSVRRDMEALLDSFLMSQDTRRSRMIVWWMDRDPDPQDPFEARYRGNFSTSIEFRRPDIAAMAVGTPIEGRHDILGMGDNLSVTKRNKLPRQLANMFRTLALHKLGGVWVDTDTLILRDLRPLYEYTGEFATQLSMSKYFNNNFMGLRKGSVLGRHMLTTIAETGLPQTTTSPGQRVESSNTYCKYVTRHGGDCYDVWYWNHGSIQLAVRQNIGIVVLPTPFSDPGYQGCYAPYLMGWHGGLKMKGLDVGQLLELIRGSAIIHTRAYNAKKPMHPESNFKRIYDVVREGADRKLSAAIPVNPHGIGRRNATEEGMFQAAWAIRLQQTPGVNRANLVEPPWYPPKPRSRVLIKLAPTAANSQSGRCIGSGREIDKNLGGNPPIESGIKCFEVTGGSQRASWAWHPHVGNQPGGYLRPWALRPKKLLCLDGDATVYGKRLPKGVAAALVVCNPERPSQRWVFVRDRLVNMATRLCMAVSATGSNITMESCGTSPQQHFAMPQLPDKATEWGTL